MIYPATLWSVLPSKSDQSRCQRWKGQQMEIAGPSDPNPTTRIDGHLCLCLCLHQGEGKRALPLLKRGEIKRIQRRKEPPLATKPLEREGSVWCPPKPSAHSSPSLPSPLTPTRIWPGRRVGSGRGRWGISAFCGEILRPFRGDLSWAFIKIIFCPTIFLLGLKD